MLPETSKVKPLCAPAPSVVKALLSHSAPKTNDVQPIAFRRPPFWKSFELPHRLPFSGYFFAQFAAFLSFAVECLRHGSRSPHFAEKQYLHLKIAAVIGDAQPIAHPDFTRRLGGLPVREDSSQFARPFRQGTRLEKSCRPQPR